MTPMSTPAALAFFDAAVKFAVLTVIGGGALLWLIIRILTPRQPR